MLDENLRRQGVAGSEVAAIHGVDEFQDAFSVWARKKGGLQQGKPSIRMVAGKCLEQGVLKLYAYCTGREIRYCDETSQHPQRPWQIYTPDALCVNEQRGVEAKVVAWDQRHQWGEDSSDIPMRVQMQAWWYMSALDFDVWDVCALIGGEPVIYEIHRDAEVEHRMLARVKEWWELYIQGDQRPPIGGNEDAARWLKQMYPDVKRPDLVQASPEEVALLTEYVQLRVQQKGLSDRQEVLETFFKSIIQDHEGLQWSEGRFTWKKSKDSQKVQWENMARGLMQNYVKDEETRAAMTALYTVPKPGSRRIWCDHADLRNAGGLKLTEAAV